MRDDLKKAKSLLEEGGYTCVAVKGERVYTATERGVAPLLNFLDSGISLEDFAVADKVVGRAAAYLYCLLKIDTLYARVISTSACEVLAEHGIAVTYDEMASEIRNRSNTGRCPMEECVADIQTAEEALPAIREKRRQLLAGK